MGNINERAFFRYQDIQKRRRRVTGWKPSYHYHDPVLHRFFARFGPEGQLSFGEKRRWIDVQSHVLLKGVFWQAPKIAHPQRLRARSKASFQPADDTTYVYLIRMGRTQLYKIGKSNEPAARVSALQTANPYKLKLLHAMPADNAAAAEEALHAALFEQRREGEWFTLSPAQKERLTALDGYQNGRFCLRKKTVLLSDLNSYLIRAG